MKMNEKLKPVLRQFGIATLWGLGFGIPVGYAATRYGWGFGYFTAIGMTLACAYTVQIFSSLTEVYFYPRFDRFSRGKKLASRMSSSLLAHVLGWLLPVWITGLIVGFSLFRWEVLIWLGIFIVVVLIVHSFQLLTRFYRELRGKDVLEEKLRTLAAQAELKALRAQINPHFLFNSLNTIASLISTNPPKAEEAVERLADVFRYALSASDKEFVTLRDELDIIDSYLEIEKARFGDKLKISRDVPLEILDTSIPSLILQPLVENSIKHGFTENGVVRMEITGYMDGNLVRVEIKDEGKGIPEEIKRGIYTNGTGLRNVNERLNKIYGDDYGLELKENKPNGTIAVVAIPKVARRR
jgi:two-component sensor histidine kinase